LSALPLCYHCWLKFVIFSIEFKNFFNIEPCPTMISLFLDSNPQSQDT
jgi:hypothetical protein